MACPLSSRCASLALVSLLATPDVPSVPFAEWQVQGIALGQAYRLAPSPGIVVSKCLFRSDRCSWPRCCHDRQQGPHLGCRMNGAGAAQQALGFEGVAQRQEVHRGTSELAYLTFHVLYLFQLGAASAAGLGAFEQGAADWTLRHGVNQVSR